MKTIENILTPQIKTSISNYAKLGIEITVLELENDVLIVKVHQKRLFNGFVLSQKQLIERGQEIFKTIGVKVRIRPLTYTLDIRDITPEWIEAKMKEFNIKRKDVISHLHIDKSTFSLYLNGSRNMSRMGKAAFFWYFLSFELNRDFREELNR